MAILVSTAGIGCGMQDGGPDGLLVEIVLIEPSFEGERRSQIVPVEDRLADCVAKVGAIASAGFDLHLDGPWNATVAKECV